MNKSDLRSLIDQIFVRKAQQSEIAGYFQALQTAGRKEEANQKYQELILEDRELLIAKNKLIGMIVKL